MPSQSTASPRQPFSRPTRNSTTCGGEKNTRNEVPPVMCRPPTDEQLAKKAAQVLPPIYRTPQCSPDGFACITVHAPAPLACTIQTMAGRSRDRVGKRGTFRLCQSGRPTGGRLGRHSWCRLCLSPEISGRFRRWQLSPHCREAIATIDRQAPVKGRLSQEAFHDGWTEFYVEFNTTSLYFPKMNWIV